MKKSIFIFCVGIFLSTSFAYTPSIAEVKIMQHIEGAVRVLSETGGKESLSIVLKRLEDKKNDILDDRFLYMLDFVEKVLHKYLEKHGIKKDNNKGEDISKTKKSSISSHDKKQEAGVFVASGLVAFYNVYKSSLTGNVPISDLCTKYYTEIDTIAKEYDFPTALIIATRYREHTCIFDNPSNSRGNFQITTAYYKPGPITWSQFRKQVIDFINFSRKKRAWYETFWKFDKIPVILTYSHIDLLSLQKHSLLYNGLRAGNTPQNNLYANENFNQQKSGRDGIVAMTLKAIGRSIKHGNVEKNVEDHENKKKEAKKEAKKGKEEAKKNQGMDSIQKSGINRDCVETFTINLKKGDKNVSVKKLQTFLKEQGFFTRNVTDYYGDLTEEAVNAFQAYYKSDILDPGGYTEPTGNRYTATRRKANALLCE